MLMEVYYEHYSENCRGRYWEAEEKSIPYMVLFPSNDEMQQFISKLRTLGFSCVSNNSSYRALLVNVALKRCAVITKACKHSCVGDRNYTPEEFEREILK